MILLITLYWVVSSKKNADREVMDSSISTSMSEMTLMMSAAEELVDCCSKNAAASAGVIFAEKFVVVVKFLFMSSFGVVCRF